jgi:hypothetical protein
MATEGWSYGVSMYFCEGFSCSLSPDLRINFILELGFVAFTSIGYGDYHPDTPAGRSIFVVWAILGVGTMTILISGASTCKLNLTFIHCLRFSHPRCLWIQIPKRKAYQGIRQGCQTLSTTNTTCKPRVWTRGSSFASSGSYAYSSGPVFTFSRQSTIDITFFLSNHFLPS